MLKSLLKVGLVIAISINIVGCASECNQEVLKEKTAELSQKLQELTSSGDTAKMMKFMQKLQSIPSGQTDLQAACDAVDALLDEI